MKNIFFLCATSLLCASSIKASHSTSTPTFSESLLEIDTSIGQITVYQPEFEEMQRTAPLAKAIFIEAFSTSYTEYHRLSGSMDPIEKWLRLREGLTLESWLDGVFDEEYKEYLAGGKVFLYLCDSQGSLIGWLSHSPVSEKGELYLSQCSLESGCRNQKVATSAFEKVFKGNVIKELFPEAKEVKLITRKINKIAQHLYTKAGFIMDEMIDPVVYGDSYDERYVGFRLPL